MENRIPVLTTRYGLILNFDDVFECAGKDRVEIIAELSSKFLTEKSGFSVKH